MQKLNQKPNPITYTLITMITKLIIIFYNSIYKSGEIGIKIKAVNANRTRLLKSSYNLSTSNSKIIIFITIHSLYYAKYYKNTNL